jgi:hypothetical protein
MATGTEGSRTKTALIVLGVVGLSACVVALGVGLVLKKVADDAFGPATWGVDAVSEADLPKVFGVHFPARPALVRSRMQGFQDAMYEGLVKLPPGGKAAFLSANGLTPSTTLSVGLVGDVDAAKAELRVQQPGAAPITAQPLEGLADLEGPDGGYVELFRSAVLLEADGEAWVYLVAFST